MWDFKITWSKNTDKTKYILLFSRRFKTNLYCLISRLLNIPGSNLKIELACSTFAFEENQIKSINICSKQNTYLLSWNLEFTRKHELQFKTNSKQNIKNPQLPGKKKWRDHIKKIYIYNFLGFNLTFVFTKNPEGNSYYMDKVSYCSFNNSCVVYT